MHAAGIRAAGIHAAGIHAAGTHAAGIHAAGVHAAGIHAAGIHAAGVPHERTLGWSYSSVEEFWAVDNRQNINKRKIAHARTHARTHLGFWNVHGRRR